MQTSLGKEQEVLVCSYVCLQGPGDCQSGLGQGRMMLMNEGNVVQIEHSFFFKGNNLSFSKRLSTHLDLPYFLSTSSPPIF